MDSGHASSVLDAIDRIQSSSLTKRQSGLLDLKILLEISRKTFSFSQLEDKTVHLIYEAIFKSSTLERSSYVKGGKPNVQKLSSQRLLLCATVLRLAIEVTVKRIRTKTVKALLDHICQSLPAPGDGFCEPLTADYLKALKLTLAYSPHVEHLSRSLWVNIVEFCLESITLLENGIEVASNSLSSRFSGSQPANGTENTMSDSASRNTRAHHGEGEDNKILVLSLLECVLFLVSASNCPVLDLKEPILATIIGLLKTRSYLGEAHIVAFGIVNKILAKITIESVTLTCQTVEELFPIIKSSWAMSKQSLRDEMIIILVQLEIHLSSLLGTSISNRLLPEIESLLEAMTKDYSKYSDKAPLDLEDLDFGKSASLASSHHPLRTGCFGLRQLSQKTEYCWSIVYLMAFMINWIDFEIALQYDKIVERDSIRSKRQRQAVYFDELVRRVQRDSSSSQICALQTICFLVQQRVLSVEEMSQLFEALLIHVSGQNSATSSWAMVAIASSTFQIRHFAISSQINALKPYWSTAWQLASRLVTSASHCRSACNLLCRLLEHRLVEPEVAGKTMDLMTTSWRLNGPALLSDSALALWSVTSQMVGIRGMHIGDGVATDQLLSWIFSNFNRSYFDKGHSRQISHTTSISDIVDCIGTAIIQSWLPNSPAHFLSLGVIGQAWLRCNRNRTLIRYLLLLDDNRCGYLIQAEDGTRTSTAAESALNFEPASKGELIVIELFIEEINRLIRQLTEMDQSRSLFLNPDSMYVLSTFCISAEIVSSTCRGGNNESAAILAARVGILAQEIFTLASREDSYALLEVLLLNISPFLPAQLDQEDNNVIYKIAPDFMARISQAVSAHKGRLETKRHKINDEMDLDSEFESQENRQTIITEEFLFRYTIEAQTSQDGFYSSIEAYITFACSLSESARSNGNFRPVPSSYFEYLFEKPANEFLACGQFISMLACSEPNVPHKDAERLLLYIGENFLGSFEYERCEVAIDVCLAVMRWLVPVWSDKSRQSLREAGDDIYKFIVDTLSGKDILSPSSQVGIADLLYAILSFQPEYTPLMSTTSVSVRTSLFQILRHGELLVKYHVAKRVSVIFGYFPLTLHDLIFEDVQNSLPRDISWPEGMSIRLLVLSELASNWSSLLRRCVYHIFETAGLVTNTVKYATRCVRNISKSLDLPGSLNLFRLFRSQILYTWLETQHLESIPYAVFEFSSLADLLLDAQDEIVSQSIMRGSSKTLKDLENALETRLPTLLNTSFSLAVAYGLAKDISSPDRSRSVENRIKGIVGVEKWMENIHANFECIIGQFFLRLHEEDHFDKALVKLGTFPKASQALAVMRDISWSKNPMPAGQQPLFRSKYLIPQIERLCRRTLTKANIRDIWTPFLVTYVARMLLDDIHKEMGPMHCRRTIQRIRILIALSGDTVLENYPLQMLVHALRSFITDEHCSEDAIGVFTYLLTHGKASLTLNPAFFGGITISLFLSLRGFRNTLQDVNTPPTQPLITISRIQEFHQWLSEYIHQFEPKYEVEASSKSFKSALNTAKMISSIGTAAKDTVEGSMLWQLLVEMKVGRIGLSQSFLQLCLNLLCKEFAIPSSVRDDILGTTEKAVGFITELWRTCEKRPSTRNYRIWVAKIMGRSFRANGKVPIRMSRENNMHLSKPDYESISTKFPTSRLAIVRHIIDMLFCEKPSDVGLLEKSLRLILSRARGREDEQLIRDCFPDLITASFATESSAVLSDPNPDISRLPEWPDWFNSDHERPYSEWIRGTAIATANFLQDDPIIGSVSGILQNLDGFAELLFPYMFHSLVLRAVAKTGKLSEKTLTTSICAWFLTASEKNVLHTRLLINAMLYLRTQPNPFEANKADRSRWLDVDYGSIAHAAKVCKMSKSALLFIELNRESVRANSPDSSGSSNATPDELLLSIFSEIDEPDSYYGVPQKPLLNSIADRLEFEGSGVQSLLFRGAQLDSLYRSGQSTQTQSLEKVIRALTAANLNGLTAQLVKNPRENRLSTDLNDNMLRAAQRLGQWDILVSPGNESDTGNVYSAFKSFLTVKEQRGIQYSIDANLAKIFDRLRDVPTTRNAMRSSLRALAALTEIDDVAGSRSSIEISDALDQLAQREEWMSKGHLEDIAPILLTRETFTAMLIKNSNLRKVLQQTPTEAHLIDVRTNLQSSSLYREHRALQEALSTVTYLSQQIESCQREDLQVDGAIRDETASVLWDRGELVPAINILRELSSDNQINMQSVRIGKPHLLAKLGRRVSDARLESSEDIQKKYLMPALEHLGNVFKGEEAGHVFHDFASYCHQQLRNPELKAEITRIEKLRNQKQIEIEMLSEQLAVEKKSRATSSKQKNVAAMRALQDAKKWLDIDLIELERLNASRESFLTASLDYYLKSLAASNSHDDDALRFFEIWLEFSNDPAANQSAGKFLSDVANYKFAHLMNQLVSRLEDNASTFQKSLSSLICRICVDHPYHGMYQLCSASNVNSAGTNDRNSRTSSAEKIVSKLKADTQVSGIWNRIQQAHLLCLRLAEWSAKEDYKVNGKILVTKVTPARRVARDLPSLSLPPVTLSIDVRANCEYADVPIVDAYDKELRVMNGNSAPKLASLTSSDGVTHKQLFKSNDDLRQDAIMEQVFGEVNAMLKRNPATRQRDLGIRTYNVLPLSSTAGIIEFVQQTIAIHEFLVPAHQSYHPTDLKFVSARNKILEAEKESVQKRIKVYQDVAQRYQPVMRYFFFERFLDPDDWFQRRLAYTRSNATISILGHALGLGDRHCHNILLDQRTGEVVHIDLGIAFEAGRVLKIPEVVPFRLTRDIVDGFGIMKTEGIFRRCCGFTLEALRGEKESIMTLLNVLRYDPLYRWTLSPIRAKRAQEAQDQDVEMDAAAPILLATNTPRTSLRSAQLGNEEVMKRSPIEENLLDGGEAERALTVVERKLSKGLSVEAAVNELIQQATDEKNLALLFCGWAPFS